MKGKTALFGMVIILTVFIGAAWAGMPVPVSPGGGTGVTGQTCPAFSWSATSGALSYKVEVYGQVMVDAVNRDIMRGMGNPIIEKVIHAPALTWTPSSGECLSRGAKYIWYVQGIDGEGQGQWSEGIGFQVETAALTVDQREAVQEVVKDYLSGAGSETAANTPGQVKAPDGIVPMYTEEVDNNFFGSGAGANITTGIGNTFIGAYAGNSNDEGHTNSFLGRYSGFSNTTGDNNSFFGVEAGYWNNGSSNSFVGAYAGGGGSSTGSNNSFFGVSAGYLHKTGDNNSFLGARSGYSNNTGYNNIFLGYETGYSNNSGYNNSIVGYRAGYSNGSGYRNSFLGSSAGHDNVAGNNNSFVGHGSGTRNKGSNNSFLGAQTGFYNIDGDSNVFIGYWAGYSETGSDRLYIDNCFTGNTAITGGLCSQPLIYGEFDNRLVRIDGSLEMVSVATPSDIRYKKDIHPLESSLEKVIRLHGVTYEWDKDKVNGAGYKDGRQIGLIAQEVEEVLPELVQTDSKGYKTLSYDKLGPVLIEAVKEQQKTISEQKAMISELTEKLEKALDMIQRRLASLENPSRTLALK